MVRKACTRDEDIAYQQMYLMVINQQLKHVT